MIPEKLKHLIYTSTAIASFDLAELKEILDRSRVRNAERAVTGMLLYTERSFFQVLEGGESTLDALFARIASDPRHKRVIKIIDEPIAQRDFGDWSMGFTAASAAELSEIEGLGDSVRKGNSFDDLQPGRARKLLSAFAAGRWRRGLRSDAA